MDNLPKIQKLKKILHPLLENGLIIAFSGGVDSGFLLWAAVETQKEMQMQGKSARLLALLTVSASVPPWEIQEAKAFAEILNVQLYIHESQELQQEAYAKNDGSRCYYCKSELFRITKEYATRLNYQHIAYGYNASDRKDVRLGHLAAAENTIHAPLDEAGLEKEEIRAALRECGLSLADKPASPCLASRVMVGVRVTPEKLHHVLKMEDILRNAGIHIYRVRIHEEKTVKNGVDFILPYFRIEVAPAEMQAVLTLREVLIEAGQSMGYRWVNLDLAGYKLGGGTLNS